MEYMIVTLKRHAGPNWIFSWDDEYNGLIHRTKKNIYKLFFEDIATSYKPVWIGLLDRNAWVTWEREIKAKSIDLIGCTIVFN